ncbi:MAG: hypothetical protein IJZ89_00355 [Clostridia bacterium]|nr:hypothetical protein [Clostridia bacterium]
MKKKRKKQSDSKIRKWLCFIIFQLVFIAIAFSGLYENRKVSIDDCERIVTKIIDIKIHDSIRGRDVVYLNTGSEKFYIDCYKNAVRKFPVEDIIKEKEIIITVKKTSDLWIHEGLREIVDLRSNETIYLDYQVFDRHAKVERICGYIILPLLWLLITFGFLLLYLDVILKIYYYFEKYKYDKIKQKRRNNRVP